MNNTFAQKIVDISNDVVLDALNNELKKHPTASAVHTLAQAMHDQTGLNQHSVNIDNTDYSSKNNESWGDTDIKNRAGYMEWKKYQEPLLAADSDSYYHFVDTLDIRITGPNLTKVYKKTKESMTNEFGEVITKEVDHYAMVGGELQKECIKRLKAVFNSPEEVYIIKSITNAMSATKMTETYCTFLLQTPNMPFDYAIQKVNEIMQEKHDFMFRGDKYEIYVTEMDTTQNVPGTTGTYVQCCAVAEKREKYLSTSQCENSAYLNTTRFKIYKNQDANGLYSHTFEDAEFSTSHDDPSAFDRVFENIDHQLDLWGLPPQEIKPYHTHVKYYDKLKYQLEVKSVRGNIENSLEYLYNPEYTNLEKAYTAKATHELGLSRVECTFRYSPDQRGPNFQIGTFEKAYLDAMYETTDSYLVRQSMQLGYIKLLDTNRRNSVVYVYDKDSPRTNGCALIRSTNPATNRSTGISYNMSAKTPAKAFQELALYNTLASKPVDLYVIERSVDGKQPSGKYKYTFQVVGFAVLNPDPKHTANLTHTSTLKTRPSKAQVYQVVGLSWARVGLPDVAKDFTVNAVMESKREIKSLHCPTELGGRVTKATQKKDEAALKRARKSYADRLVKLEVLTKGELKCSSRYKKWHELKVKDRDTFVVGYDTVVGRFGTFVVMAVSTNGTKYNWYTTNAALKRVAERVPVVGLTRLDSFHNTGETYKGNEIWTCETTEVDVEGEYLALTGKPLKK